MAERVELHLHTSSSEDISVITPKDVIDAAVRMGHKAVAVTCCNSAQDFPELDACLCKYGKITQKLLAAGIPEWYVESMKKIRYLFPQAHAAAYTKLSMSLAWFKIYYLEQFYNVALRV